MVYELRVRDATAEHDAFRRVCFFDTPPWCMSLRDIKSKICSKFEASGAVDDDGGTLSPPGRLGMARNFVRQMSGGVTMARSVSEDEYTRSVECLVRLSDRLEVCDDEDVTELRNGDRLEVTFTRIRKPDDVRPTPAHSAPILSGTAPRRGSRGHLR